MKTRCTHVSNVGAKRYFLSQIRSADEVREHLYSTSVVIITVNGEMDDSDYATNDQQKSAS